MLHYKLLGKGPLIVCVHGFLENLSIWKEINWEKLGVQALVIDLPGHGDSSFQPEETSPDLFYPVSEILKLLKELNVDKYDIIGHSLGGYIALEIAKKDLRCNKTILLNSNYWPDSLEKKKDRIRVADIVFRSKLLFLKQAIPSLFGNPLKHKGQIENLIRQASTYSPESIAYYSLAMRNRKDFSNQINLNHYIIQGNRDIGLNKIQLRDCENKFKDRFFLIKGVGHMAIYESIISLEKIMQKILRK